MSSRMGGRGATESLVPKMQLLEHRCAEEAIWHHPHDIAAVCEPVDVDDVRHPTRLLLRERSDRKAVASVAMRNNAHPLCVERYSGARGDAFVPTC